MFIVGNAPAKITDHNSFFCGKQSVLSVQYGRASTYRLWRGRERRQCSQESNSVKSQQLVRYCDSFFFWAVKLINRGIQGRPDIPQPDKYIEHSLFIYSYKEFKIYRRRLILIMKDYSLSTYLSFFCLVSFNIYCTLPFCCIGLVIVGLILIFFLTSLTKCINPTKRVHVIWTNKGYTRMKSI